MERTTRAFVTNPDAARGGPLTARRLLASEVPGEAEGQRAGHHRQGAQRRAGRVLSLADGIPPSQQVVDGGKQSHASRKMLTEREAVAPTDVDAQVKRKPARRKGVTRVLRASSDLGLGAKSVLPIPRD